MQRSHSISTDSTGSLWEELDQIEVAEVVVDIDAPDLLPTYAYRVPESLLNTLAVGDCVHVPFGGRETLGYVLERRSLAASDPLAKRLREVIAPVQGAVSFSGEQAELARWIAARCVCDLASVVRCVAPAAMGARVVTVVRLAAKELRGQDVGDAMLQAHVVETLRSLGGIAELETLRDAARISAFSGAYHALLRKGAVTETREVSRARTVARMVRAYALGGAADALNGRTSPAGRRILEALITLERAGETPVLPEKLLTQAQASAGALKTLVGSGAVVVQEVALRRAPTIRDTGRTTPPPLSPGQQNATQHLSAMIRSGTHHAALLWGVTASGKTEVYLDAIAETLDSGRTALVLVPEIALTTQVVEIFTGRFGDEVAVLHSRLSEGERHDEWRRLQEGKARIAVGARSAVFAPLGGDANNIGLIVLDEEHEASYKQESLPRYHARDVSVERTRRAGATLLLGSATPSLETFYATEQGEITRLEMPDRIDNRPLPQVSVVDLREEFKTHKALFSRALLDEIGVRLVKKQQTILFLNRRGYAQFVLCRECGYVARCPNCAVSLAFHAAWNALKCHHCDYGKTAPNVCPDCGGTKIRGFGIGTEKVEEEVGKYFPSARVVRLDRDTTARKGAHSSLLRQFREGEADILIGTQMIAKGLDFPNVTLVGVVSADTSINMPDFRAAERTFQLLTQVAGRAGRGEHPGTVIIQTFSPDHYSVQRAMRQDYRGFYEKEIGFREELLYPPFSRFVNLLSSDEDSPTARGRAETLANACRLTLSKDIEIIGPAPAPLSRLKNLYRWHVVLRAPTALLTADELSENVRRVLATLSTSERFGLTVDINPMSMA